MKLRTLTEDAYLRFRQYEQVLQKQNRGYGLVFIKVENILFAIPLRSNLNHRYGMKTVFDKFNGNWNGLDYTKALVVSDEDLNPVAFKPRRSAEYEKIKRNKDKIAREFGEYVEEYIAAIRSGDELDRKFSFTTLQYFHQELGL